MSDDYGVLRPAVTLVLNKCDSGFTDPQLLEFANVESALKWLHTQVLKLLSFDNEESR